MMINKKEIKKMWVWDGDFLNPKTQRYILFKAYDYYIAVDKNSEKSFENGGDFDVEPWENCEPIKEPSFDDLPEGWENALYRFKNKYYVRKILIIDYGHEILYFSDPRRTQFPVLITELINDWQIKVNGEWHDCSEYLGE